VNHLHVVAGPRAADVEIAALRGERLEDRLERLDRVGRPADHQAVTHLEAPNSAARAGVDVLDALRRELRLAPLVIVEVRVAAVDDRVTRLEVLHQLGDLGLGRITGRDHDPDRARLLELRHELLDRERSQRALACDLLRLLGRPVVGHDLVVVAE
jgi:hypothetical protein